ncbi:multicopper oxidase domain-containing protein [Actinoallomurus sp. NPDC052308]|uniref:multicopper oxidase domain-containing protein n=1 Tax=Actinoallomurus sp. NPDC052308 TaxID=3155530 RepID=UPI0034375459
MNLTTQLALGLAAGGTIFLGLLAGRWPVRNATLRTGLGMLAAGILVYLMVEIVGNTAGQVSTSWRDAVGGHASHGRAFGLTVLLVVGFLIGLAGLAWLQQRLGRLLTRNAQRRVERRARLAEAGEAPTDTTATTAAATPGEQLALAIASGIGLHNLSEGLAIGQSAATGRTALAAGLVIGFALHNSTEGFGIVGPLVTDDTRVPWRKLGFYGLLGGGPTFLGVLLGGVWTSQAVDVFVLAVAGGALLYVIGQLLGGLRRQAAQVAAMTFLAAGFAIGWGTEVTATVALNGGSTTAAACSGGTTEADGDVIGGTCASASAKAPQPALAAADAKRQQQTAADLLHETALRPTIEADGTRHYTLTASQFPWQLYPGRVVNAWGYNGSVPGPLLRFTVGDKVAITLVNHLPQPTTVHWHGLAVPQAADGDPMTAPSVAPGGTATYRFTVTDQMVGTHWYHSHVNTDFQVDAGLHGALIVDPAPHSPAAAATPATGVDALVTLSAFKIAGSETENAFTIDGKAHPLAPTLTVRQGQRLRLRLINDSAEQSHVMHLHGYTWTQIARDGNPVTGQANSNNINLGPGETADMLVVANNPGTWMLQCHILDHQINPGPNGDGDATHMADMGGLTTFLTVTR